MPDLSRFRALATKEKAIVALGVLLDGYDAGEYLNSDRERAIALSRAARDLAELSPDIRVPLAGTLLRAAVAELQAQRDSRL